MAGGDDLRVKRPAFTAREREWILAAFDDVLQVYTVKGNEGESAQAMRRSFIALLARDRPAEWRFSQRRLPALLTRREG